WLDNNKVEGSLPTGLCSLPLLWRFMISNNYLYGPLPDCLFDKCINQIDVSGNSLYGMGASTATSRAWWRSAAHQSNLHVPPPPLLPTVIDVSGNSLYGRINRKLQHMVANSVCFNLTSMCRPPPPLFRASHPYDVSGNSLYGRINRDFKGMVANSGALVNLARNFFFGEAVLFAAGCKVCPTEVSEPNSLGLKATSNWRVSDGNCNNALPSYLLQDYAVTGAGLKLRVSLSGNCLTLSPSTECSVNATQRSTAACQAFCSITDNGPCDGHGVSAIITAAQLCLFVCSHILSTHLLPWSFIPLVLMCAQRSGRGWMCVSSSRCSRCLRPPTTGRDDNVLGKGGFGIVYKGRSSHGQLWAIKRSTIMTNDFETEVRTMASLHHTHLVRLLGFCLDQNVETGKQEQILVYEFIGNRDLEYHIHATKRPLSLRQRLRLAQGAADGLAYLHGFDTPIVHRDIKPANILVSADMQAKVADFGLLKRLTHGDADATRWPALRDMWIRITTAPTSSQPRVTCSGYVGNLYPAMKRVEAYDLEELRDSKMPAVSEEAIVDFADLALDCIKSPGTRRPTMKDVACRLSALIAKHCPDREDEWESVAKEESEGNDGISSRDVSAASFESSGREAESDVNL
ncbi:unnamed protein product, partial [Closterium sp. NIES-64]